MKGRKILIEPRPGGGHAAALLVDGRLEDLLIDPGGSEEAGPAPEAVYRALPGRQMKGLGGVIVDLGRGLHGFLRGAKSPAPGRPLLVQVSGWAEPGKAPPVTTRLLLKGRTAILTPGAPGVNIARGLRGETRRAELEALGAAALAGADQSLGLIVRSAAADADDGEIAGEIAALRRAWERLAGEAGSGRGALLLPAPGARAEALREWTAGAESLGEGAGALETAGVWDEVEALCTPRVPLGDGFLAIEPTRALVAVDVNTGGELSPAGALKVNLAAAAELPRQLRLRGLGGQVTIDFAPLARSERPRIERALQAALRGDGIDTTIAGWTPLGHLELQRKRARRPLPSSF